MQRGTESDLGRTRNGFCSWAVVWLLRCGAASTTGGVVVKARLGVELIAFTMFPEDTRFGEGYPWKNWNPGLAKPADALTEFAGRLCYQSWDNPAKRTNKEYIGNILSQKHYSVIEHSGFTIAITGLSRACTHELVRHRHFSFSQLSQRFVDEQQARFVVPPLFRGDPAVEKILEKHFQRTLEVYGELVERGKDLLPDGDKKMRRKRVREAARAVLPNMTETQIVMSGNHRSWREFFEKRGNKHADLEINEVAKRTFRIAQRIAPAIYQDMQEEAGEIVLKQHALA